MEYAVWVASAQCQKTIYVQSGGQPGNKTAWVNSQANEMTNQFFDATLPTLERAFLRPRFPDYVEFQTQASFVISDFLREKQDAASTLHSLDECFSRANATK